VTCEYCIDPNGEDCYPQYGPAPHECFYKKGTPIGSSTVLPKEHWPDNFIEDPDVPGLGTWYCPHCRDGMAQLAAEEGNK
jgi:hypothetical protein